MGTYESTNVDTVEAVYLENFWPDIIPVVFFLWDYYPNTPFEVDVPNKSITIYIQNGQNGIVMEEGYWIHTYFMPYPVIVTDTQFMRKFKEV